MNREIVDLVIVVGTISLSNKRVILSFIQDSLDNIDKITLKYENKDEFFNSKKEKILDSIYAKTDLIISDIYLDEIYIETGEKRISPLFKQIYCDGKYILLDDIIRYRLMQGNMEKLYDIARELFLNLDSELIEELDMHYVTPKIVNAFLNSLKKRCDYYKLVRILLLNRSRDELRKRYQKYLNDSKEEKKRVLKKEIRLPYKDD